MRFCVRLLTKAEPLRLPVHHNRLLQAAIYSRLDRETAKLVHDRGYGDEGRGFKMFTFSRLMGRYDMDREAGIMRFSGPLRLVISSPMPDFCSSLLTSLLTQGNLELGGQEVVVEEVQTSQPRVTRETAVFRTLSPVVVYSTVIKGDGTKYTCYFQPGEPEFAALLTENLKKKFKVVFGEPPEGTVRVRPLGQPRLSIVKYAGTVIKGYSGRISIEGPVKLLQIGLDAGVGAKNSQGFGCVELEEQKAEIKE
ncbi:MAG: CRISPR-associated endoribonuclease Cas6 [Bacillota bacterium]|nr:CRISPR-associated endoribonuclease Cas6 [Bacillota bacterium]